MKKITLLMAVLTAVCLNGFTQSYVDLGWDWTGTYDSPPTSGTYISSTENVVYPGSNNEIVVFTGGLARLQNSDGGLYVNKRIKTYEYLEIITNQTDYIEVSVTDNSAAKTIQSAKINGTSSTVDVAGECAVLFCDVYPFNEQRVIFYESYPLAMVRVGNAGVSLNVPSGCKSFRIYRKVQIEQTSTDPACYKVDEFGSITVSGSTNSRIGYFGISLIDDNATGLEIIENNKTVVATKYFDITGKEVTKENTGFIIEKRVFDDGSIESVKVIKR
ncbi:hypothetical protein D0T50_01065 [Bacteroides sp. 214]|uniref:hypothetical protein n=1 Tax=Bacteroides sp. 214 TaxID=2302935 RepID=UPI0013D37198|nr:hypothetical protein [Bacteroides sp. 214]NDW11479.1 hypothetical protein [Bacteroides sp. 214]